MRSLNLDDAIAQAMRGLSGSGTTYTGTLTTRPQVTVGISGSRIGENSQSRFSGVSTQGGSSFTLKSAGGVRSGSGSSGRKTAIVGQVLNVLNPQIEQAVANALRSMSSSSSSSFGTSNELSSSFGTSNQQSTFSSGSNQIRGSSAQDESSLVTQIISMLTPTITTSVQSALSGQSSSAQQTVSSQGVDQNALAQQVLTALGPTITAQVQAAIASMQSSSSSSSSQSNNQGFQQVQTVQ